MRYPIVSKIGRTVREYFGRQDRAVVVAIIVASVAGVALVTWFVSGSTLIRIANQDVSGPRSLITDLPCEEDP